MKVKTKISSSGYGGSILGGAAITTFLTIIAGPIGFIAGAALTGAAIKDTYDSAKTTIENDFNQDDEKKLIEKYKNKNGFKVDIKSYDTAGNPPISKFLFRNNVKKTYYFENDDE